MTKIYVIEDQTILRDLVCRLVEEMANFELLGSSGDGLEGLQACQQLKPDMIIVDIMVPSLNGLEIIRQLRRDRPEIRVLIFSGYSSREHVQIAIKSGVNGIVHKNASIDELEVGIQRVSNGESFMSSVILDILRDLMLNPNITDSLEKLTGREREILQLIAEGHTTKAIAGKLNISAKTADTHRTNIMNKLDIHDIASLTRFAIQNGLVQP